MEDKCGDDLQAGPLQMKLSSDGVSLLVCKLGLAAAGLSRSWETAFHPFLVAYTVVPGLSGTRDDLRQKTMFLPTGGWGDGLG